MHGDGILSDPVYRSKHPSSEVIINVGNTNTANGYIVPTNRQSKHTNESKNIAVKNDTFNQFIRITPRNKTNLSHTTLNNNNYITNIDNKIKKQENNNKPQISSKINRYINTSHTTPPNGKFV